MVAGSTCPCPDGQYRNPTDSRVGHRLDRSERAWLDRHALAAADRDAKQNRLRARDRDRGLIRTTAEAAIGGDAEDGLPFLDEQADLLARTHVSHPRAVDEESRRAVFRLQALVAGHDDEREPGLGLGELRRIDPFGWNRDGG